jgi:hypothetical protein
LLIPWRLWQFHLQDFLVGENAMPGNDATLKTYRVRVGHWEVRVNARDSEEAIVIAKRHLSRELPRLYDVIRSLTANRFQVEHAA